MDEYLRRWWIHPICREVEAAAHALVEGGHQNISPQHRFDSQSSLNQLGFSRGSITRRSKRKSPSAGLLSQVLVGKRYTVQTRCRVGFPFPMVVLSQCLPYCSWARPKIVVMYLQPTWPHPLCDLENSVVFNKNWKRSVSEPKTDIVVFNGFNSSLKCSLH